MIKEVQCPKCHAHFSWDTSSAVAACTNCGTKYQLRSRSSQQPVLMPPQGRGCVDYVTVPNDSTVGNRPLIKTYIPKNWTYQCAPVSDRFDLVSNPLVLSITFLAPDQSAKIVFVGESFYKHIDYMPQTAALQNRLEDSTTGRNPTFFRLKSYHTAAEYCDALAQSCGLSQLSLVDESRPEATERERQERIIQNFLRNGFLNASGEWAGRTYSGVSPEGQKLKVYAETRVTQLMRIAAVQSLQMQPMGSVFGMRYMPQMVQQQVEEYFWDTSYELVLLAAEAAFDKAFQELKQLDKTLDYLPGMQDVRAELISLAQNAQMNMAQVRSESFARQSRIIADTNAYTSNIQHQMMADNAASHDWVARMQSEMIREVNSYAVPGGGVAEASTRYDHVYQSTRDPNVFGLQQGDAFEFGVDFVELPRTNGNY